MHLSRFRTITVGAIFSGLLILTGCSSQEVISSGQNGTAVPTRSSTPSQVAPDTPDPSQTSQPGSALPEPPPFDPDARIIKPSSSASGANAAPAPQFYDSSSTAKQQYYDWWLYEVQVPQDYRDFQTLYTDGVAVCATRARGVGVGAIETVWNKEMGYTPSGASAIIQAAFLALCPQYNLGYETYFDKNVLAFANSAVKYVRFSTTDKKLYEFGTFMKENCASLDVSTIGGTGIYDHMTGLVNANYFTLLGPPADQQVMRVLINEATKAGCYGYTSSLPPIIQSAS